MKYAAVVLDLDGTLLNTDKNISDRNLNAILNCHRNGLKIIFATARPPRTVNFLLPEELLKIGSFIYYNGGLISCKTSGVEEHIPIDRRLSSELLDFCIQLNPYMEISLEVRDEWYSFTEIDYSMIQRRRGNPIVKTLDELKLSEPTKILITTFGDGLPIVERFSSELNMVITDNGKLFQVMSKEASKENGIRLLCGKLGIELNQIISFGDDHNDMGMLMISGLSIAMGNAVEELKAVADEVTASNDDDGVAQVLERILWESQS